MPTRCRERVLLAAITRLRATLRIVLPLFGVAVLLPAVVAQGSGQSYRQTVLSIQEHIKENDLDGARELIANATRQFPADGGIENLLGVVEIQQGHADRAKKAFSVAIRHSPKLVSAYLNLGRVMMQDVAGDSKAQEEALRVYEKALQMEPANAEANYNAAVLLMWAKSYQRSLDRVMKMSAEDRRQAGEEALVCADEAGLGDKEAADRAAAALVSNPGLTEQTALEIAPTLLTAQRGDLVESTLAAVAGVRPLSAEGLRAKGLAQEMDGKSKLARTTLELAYDKDPSSEGLLVDLASLAQGEKDYQGALGYLAHARDLRPQDASLAYQFGAICLKLNLLGEARKVLGEAVKLAPENPQYNFAMGTVSSYAQDPTEALPYLEKYHALRPADTAGILELGTTYFRAREFENASSWLKQAANDDGTAATAHYYLGRIARQEGNLEEAAAELSRSLALKADQPEVLAELGQVYVSKKKYAEAESELSRAIELDPDSYAANFGLLQLYARTSDPRKDEQSKRFDAIKDKNDEKYREMMRVIEIVPQGEARK
ncbi:tetratricopeptide repeat protein [Acidicapsa acidisoli]|uniref:tetratricopeptide repeat protein n=1 Tax=Acidicapsa acidisoli TaxID=1615681 RepID=UPI0021DFDABB|nr:tetratricopeptide repeat protein [Acidicapsa acidisoli]